MSFVRLEGPHRPPPYPCSVWLFPGIILQHHQINEGLPLLCAWAVHPSFIQWAWDLPTFRVGFMCWAPEWFLQGPQTGPASSSCLCPSIQHSCWNCGQIIPFKFSGCNGSPLPSPLPHTKNHGFWFDLAHSGWIPHFPLSLRVPHPVTFPQAP